MLHDKSWSPILFELKRSNVKVDVCLHSSECQSSSYSQSLCWIIRLRTWNSCGIYQSGFIIDRRIGKNRLRFEIRAAANEPTYRYVSLMSDVQAHFDYSAHDVWEYDRNYTLTKWRLVSASIHIEPKGLATFCLYLKRDCIACSIACEHRWPEVICRDAE